MNGRYYIETLARNGDVLHRHQVASLPIRIGRGYDNDYILDDDYAAPNHAVVEEGDDGALVLRDLGSRNGIAHRGRLVDRLRLDGDTVIRIGHSNLRIRRADYAVTPELVDRTMHRWEGALPGLAGVLLIGAFALFTQWLNDFESFQWIRYLQALAAGIVAGLLWSGAWAAGNRLFGRHARLGRHLFILGAALAGVAVYKLAGSVIAYAFSLDALMRYSIHVAIAIACITLYFHLKTVRPQHPRRFAALCLSLFAIGSGLTLLSNQQRSGHFADEPYMALLLPPNLRASPDHGTDDFMRAVAALKPALDVERTKKVRNGAEEDEEDSD